MLKSDASASPRSGLTMNMWAVAGLACIGRTSAARSSFPSALASASGRPQINEPTRSAWYSRLREIATGTGELDPTELRHGRPAADPPDIVTALLPLGVVLAVNLTISLFLLPRLEAPFLAEQRWGATSLTAVGGMWAVIVALASATLTVVILHRHRLLALRHKVAAWLQGEVLHGTLWRAGLPKTFAPTA